MPLARPRSRLVFRARCRWIFLAGLVLTAALAGWDGAAVAAAGPAAHHAGRRGRRAKKASPDSSSTFLLGEPSRGVRNQRGKIVVFHFRNDDDGALSLQVGQLLEARGLQVVPDVRPVDTAEQFRDVATQLDLVGYVEGDLRPTRDGKARLTLRVRNGYTGRPVTQAVFTDTVEKLPRELSGKMWPKLAPAIAHACADASRPRHRTRTMQINAGTPL
jgi:hypothetical protein